MNLFRNISAHILLLIILTESVGIKVIKDLCLPCDHNTVAVQLAYSDFHSETQDHPAKDMACCQGSSCCEASQCNQDKHSHQKEVQVVHKSPDFFASNTRSQATFTPVILAVLEKQSFLPGIKTKISRFPVNDKSPIPPGNDMHSLLCTYII